MLPVVIFFYLVKKIVSPVSNFCWNNAKFWKIRLILYIFIYSVTIRARHSNWDRLYLYLVATKHLKHSVCISTKKCFLSWFFFFLWNDWAPSFVADNWRECERDPEGVHRHRAVAAPVCQGQEEERAPGGEGGDGHWPAGPLQLLGRLTIHSLAIVRFF